MDWVFIDSMSGYTDDAIHRRGVPQKG